MASPAIWCLTILAVLISLGDAATHCENCCLNCNGVATQEECNLVTKCGSHESCYVRKKTGLSLNTLYESGCISKQVCSTLQLVSHPGLVGKRYHTSLTNCYECCNSNSSMPCNRDLCTAKPPALLPGYKICYSCAGVKRPEDCSRTDVCTTDESCHTHARLSFDQTELRYDLGCKSKMVCKTLENLNNVPIALNTSLETIQYCYQCCDDNYCNMEKCGFLQSALPLFDKQPNNRTVVIGRQYDVVTLECKVAAASNANITWTFESLSGSHAIPSRVRIINPTKSESLLRIENFQRDILGKWTCVATNAKGSAKVDAFVKECK